MTIRLKSDSGLVAAYKNCLRKPGQPEMTFIIRGKYRLAPGEPLTLVRSEEIPDALIEKTRKDSEEAADLLDEASLSIGQGSATGEMMREDDEGRVGAPVYPGDFADYKTNAEVMMRGSCHPPSAEDTECEVGIQIGDWEKKLKVIGHRVWIDRTAGGKHTDPKPIGYIAVDDAHAYGGPGFANNPVGKGFIGEIDKDDVDDLYQPPRSERSMVMPTQQLPNVVYPNGATEKKGLAAGFGPLNSAWPYRAAKLGKNYDQKWLDTRAPYFSTDMDWRYFQAAPPDQQLKGFLRGDEKVTFTNLHPTTSRLTTRLPEVRVRVFVRDVEENSREIVMQLDTLFADIDEGELYLTWRGVTPVKEEDLTDMEYALIVTEALADEPGPVKAYIEQLEAFAADPIGLKEAFPEGFMEFAERAEKLEEATDAELEALLENAEGNSPPVAVFKNIFGKLMPPELEQLDGTWNKATENEHVDADDMKKKVLTGVKNALRGGGGDAEANVELDEETGAVPAGSKMTGNDDPIGGAVGMRLPVRDGEAVVFPIGNMMRKQEQMLLEQKEKLPDDIPEEARAEAHAKFDAALEKIRTNPELLKNDLHYRPYSEDDPPPDKPGPGADLQGHDLSDWDLSGMDLSGADMQCATLNRANLSGANLTGAKLGGARLNRADLSGANLTDVDLTTASFDRVTAKGTNFAGTRLDMFRATKSSFHEASFAGADGMLGSFSKCSLIGADFEGAEFKMLSFDECTLEEIRFGGAKLEHVRFDKCEGRKIMLERSQLLGTSFNECTLPEIQASTATGEGAVWFKTTMNGSNFYKADLIDSHFFNVNAQKSNFSEANVPGARFDRAILRDASFEKANLKGADLRKAVLSKTNFQKASLYEAQLTETAGVNVDFREANMEKANIQRSEITRR